MSNAWTTRDELDFIADMVAGHDPGEKIRKLIQYRASMKLRKDWNHIDKPRIQRAISQRLYRLREGNTHD